MDTLKGIRLFCDVADAESFSAIGRRLGISPAAVSRQIQTLEDELGVALFHRSSRKLSLTEAGQLYLRHVQPLIVRLDEAARAVSELQSGAVGMITVHARASVAVRHIAPRLHEFLSASPGLTVRFILSDGEVDMIKDNIDVSIRAGQLPDSALKARKLSEGARLLVASREYVKLRGAPRNVGDLARHNCLTYPLDLGRPLWRFRTPSGQNEEIQVEGNLICNNAEMLRIAALKGLGLAILPIWLVSEDMSRGDLIRVLGDHEASNLTFDQGIFALYHPTRWHSTKVGLFVEFLLRIFKENEAWRSGEVS